jgi:hypothetical protein
LINKIKVCIYNFSYINNGKKVREEKARWATKEESEERMEGSDYPEPE